MLLTLLLKRTTKKKIFHSSVSIFDTDKVGFLEKISKSLSRLSLCVLTKYIFLVYFPCCFSQLGGIQARWTQIGSVGSLKTSTAMYKVVRSHRTLCMYALMFSLFVFWRDRCVSSNKKPSNSNENPSISIKTLNYDQYTSYFKFIILKCQIFQTFDLKYLVF